MKKISRACGSVFSGRSIWVAVLLIFTVLLSAGSGLYAGGSFFAQQAGMVTITTTIYTTTTSWTTSTIWSTVTAVVQGVLTTVVYTTSTSTTTVTGGSTTVVTVGGTSRATDFANVAAAIPITLPAGTVQTIGINWQGTTPGNVRVGLYSDAGDKPGSLLTESASTPMSSSAGWQDITVTTVAVSAGKYWVAFLVDSPRYIYFAWLAGGQSCYRKTFGPMDATWSASSTQYPYYTANMRVTAG